MLQQVVQSLIKLGASQQIRGLKSWMTAPKQADFFHLINVDFLEAAALQADSKYVLSSFNFVDDNFHEIIYNLNE